MIIKVGGLYKTIYDFQCYNPIIIIKKNDIVMCVKKITHALQIKHQGFFRTYFFIYKDIRISIDLTDENIDRVFKMATI